MSEVEVEIIKTEETKESGIKYLNINVANSEVERNPDIVRLCADAEILEYVKSKTGHWIPMSVIEDIKAEIKALAQEYDFYADTRRKYGLWIALEIIDKHCGKGTDE